MRPHQSSRLVSEGSGKPSESMRPHCLLAIEWQHLSSLDNATSRSLCLPLFSDSTLMSTVYAVACELLPMHSYCCISWRDVFIDMASSFRACKLCTSHDGLLSSANEHAHGSCRQTNDVLINLRELAFRNLPDTPLPGPSRFVEPLMGKMKASSHQNLFTIHARTAFQLHCVSVSFQIKSVASLSVAKCS